MNLFRQETKAYHQEAALLIQFILSELFAAHAETLRLKEGPVAVEEALASLAGNRNREGMLFNWISDNGIFEKMHHFCCCFVQENPLDDKGGRAMQRSVYQVWLLCLEAQAEMRLSAENEGASIKKADVKPLLERIVAAFERACKQVWKTMERYKQDDNVLFFILRHHRELDALYGDGAARKLLRKGFRELSDAGQWLQIRYGKRGFNRLLPVIEEKMAELGGES